MKIGNGGAADRRIENVLGLRPGTFAAAFARGVGERISMHSMRPHSAALPKDGSAPRWIEILLLGEFMGRDGRGPFTADGEEIIAETKARGLDEGLPIDYDHGTFVRDDSRAAGWIRELKISGQKLLARVDWTPRGAAAIAAKEYRFVSPVFQVIPDDPNAPDEERSGRITCLRGAGLTNDPNLEMTALSAQL